MRARRHPQRRGLRRLRGRDPPIRGRRAHEQTHWPACSSTTVFALPTPGCVGPKWVQDHPTNCSAGVAAPAAAGFRINGEIHTTSDYCKAAPVGQGAGPCRLEHAALPVSRRSGSASGRALFGKAGLHRRAPVGLNTKVMPLDRAHAEQLLTARGVNVRPTPSRSGSSSRNDAQTRLSRSPALVASGHPHRRGL